MVPVVIELAHSEGEPVQTYTAIDHPNVWQVHDQGRQLKQIMRHHSIHAMQALNGLHSD